jgi:hypothetical protein
MDVLCSLVFINILYQGMTLVYKLKSGESNTTRVSFDPALSGYEEVKPRLLSMKAEAQEGLGMVRFDNLCFQSVLSLTIVL